MPAVDLPERIHRYRILEELGRGSMGRVYLAQDPNIDRRLALKVLAPQHLSHDEQESELQQRFLFEGRAAGSLDHPGIVTVYDADTDPLSGLPYLAMEYVEGRSLRQLLDASKPPSPRDLLRLLAQVAHALDYAHRHDVVHRDIKPANLLVTAEGNVKVVDFGIAKMISPAITLPGRTVGTPYYMSPEQVRGHVVDGRSDLFSLGVVLYECIVGSVPFSGDDIANIQYNIVHRRHPSVKRRTQHVDESVARIVDRALAKEASHRFQRGEAFAGALETLAMEGRATLWERLPPGAETAELAAYDDSDGLVVAPHESPRDTATVDGPAADSQGPTEAATPRRRQRPGGAKRPRRSRRSQRRDKWIAGGLFAIILVVLYLRHFDAPVLRQDGAPGAGSETNGATLQPPDLSVLRPSGDRDFVGPPQPSDLSSRPVPAPPSAESTPPADAPEAPPPLAANPTRDTTTSAEDGAEDAAEQATTTLEVAYRNFLSQAYISLWIDGEVQFTERLEAGFWKRNFATGQDFQYRLQVPVGRHSVEVHVSGAARRKIEARRLIYSSFEADTPRHLSVILQPGSEELILRWRNTP